MTVQRFRRIFLPIAMALLVVVSHLGATGGGLSAQSTSTRSSVPGGGQTTFPSTTALPRTARGVTRFVPSTPRRLLDTRTGLGGISGKLQPGQPRILVLSGNAFEERALALNVTATETDGPGWLRLWPSDEALPPTSNLNVQRAGETVANAVVVAHGLSPQVGGFPTTSIGLLPAGFLSLEASAPMHVVIDSYGVFTGGNGPGSAGAGRFRPVLPSRVLDERIDPPSGLRRSVDPGGVGPVPKSGVSAVAITVTAAANSDSGHVSVWPEGQPEPGTSILNLNGPDDVRANLALVGLGANGRIALSSSVDSRVVVDVVGWFTDGTAVPGMSGLFVPLTPERRYDSRLVAPGPLVAAQARRLTLPILGQSSDVRALAVLHNLTVTESSAPGHVVAWSDGTAKPATSNLNASAAGQTRAALAITSAGSTIENAIQVESAMAAHVIVDLFGYFML